jgi:hypothetical protein
MSPAQRLMAFVVESCLARPVPLVETFPLAPFRLDAFWLEPFVPVLAPCSLRVCRMRRRVGSATACSIRSREGSAAVMGRNRNRLKIDDCQYKKPVNYQREPDVQPTFSRSGCSRRRSGGCAWLRLPGCQGKGPPGCERACRSWHSPPRRRDNSFSSVRRPGLRHRPVC